MADYISNIEDMYSKMYKSKEQAALQKKQQSLADIEAQRNGVTNQYQELQNALKARKQSTQAQYQGLYTNLNNQQEQGKEQYYGDRNNAALKNVQNVQSIRDYMAKNNLMSSGENPDAIMRATTDYKNEEGNIYNNEQKFNRDITDKRNSYAAQEQGAYGEIDNQLSSAEREQAQKVADLMNRMRLTNEGYDSELMSYRDELEAKKLADINAYNERLRQEELQRQQQIAAQQAAAQKAAAKASSAKVSVTKQPYENANQKNIYDYYNDKKTAYGEKMDTLSQVAQDQGYSQEDREYADRIRQALRAKEYYDAAYANYRGGY